MRLPTSVIIAGRTWKVLYDKDVQGGEWYSQPGVIKIGPTSSDEEKIGIFVHEILEAILTTRNYRYDNYPDGNDLFVFNHREFINIVKDLTLALRGVLK